ncbi:MAG: hypothetical protein HQK50_05585 [Oligoflexia bacterium]|nr:hypothetical protein [Oligoflexia bacterium]MBF0365021.1 hypothetical protein [Oligoflexia bacterium]
MKNILTPGATLARYGFLLLFTCIIFWPNQSKALVSEENYNLVSAQNCSLINGKLTNCDLSPSGPHSLQDFIERNIKETAVELRTEFYFMKSTGCRFQGERIPLEIVAYENENKTGVAVNITSDFLYRNSEVMKARNSGILKRITFKIKSPYFFYKLEFAPGCQITLKIKANMPDFDNKQQAGSKLNEYQQKITDAEFQLTVLQELNLYQPAFLLMKKLALSILSTLNKNNLVLLGVLDINPDILQSMLSSETNGLNNDEKDTIEKLLTFTLTVQANPNMYKEKKVSDFFTPEEIAIFNELSNRKAFIINKEDLEKQRKQLAILQRLFLLAQEQLKDIISDKESIEVIKERLGELLEDKFNGRYGLVDIIDDIFERYHLGGN